MPIPKRQRSPLIRKYLNVSRSAQTEARRLGELKPVEPAARREGLPVLGDDQVYVLKYGTDYHTTWCQVVADTWECAPRRLFVTLLATVGERTRCTECDRQAKAARVSAAQEYHQQPRLTPEPAPPDAVVPLKVMGMAHGILFLAAGQEYRERLKETAVEPATPLYVDGRRDGLVVRLDSASDEPLLLVQLDPRATFRNGPYQVRLRHPLRRSATKPYAVESVEFVQPAP
ncbi:hypothetical protein GU243_21950 [Pseudarthrobacter psychrotolerans]|uniref:Uncharacterized protein n=1 Tax=Pseudarthrobacter psychrotolerans TaxID=2697569 RepID=A0A6P1NSY5_9MICC|nr:hypothetical protein [Pseudarthrobacter psychrotolerans]QHK21887.1 hypothetical protein GU243_21950 [Pseudarthrobacter psychrotolerans]